MKLWFIFAVLVSIPAIYVGYFDYTRAAKVAGDMPYAWATVFDVWLDYDRPGFMAFRDQYLGRAAEWEQDVKPLLKIPVFPYVILGPIFYLVWTFLAFLFGWGPFRVRDKMTHAALGRTHPSSHRFSEEKGHDSGGRSRHK